MKLENYLMAWPTKTILSSSVGEAFNDPWYIYDEHDCGSIEEEAYQLLLEMELNDAKGG